MEVRDLGELKLFFSEVVDKEDIVALARTQEQFYVERLAELEAIQARFGAEPSRNRRMAPLKLGMRVYQTAIEFWREIAANPP
jgi:hypothetical protein